MEQNARYRLEYEKHIVLFDEFRKIIYLRFETKTCKNNIRLK